MPIYPRALTSSTNPIRYAATANTEGFHLSDMTVAADITCFAVLVKTDGLGRCESAAEAVVANPDIAIGGIPQGGEISFEVPNGEDRVFYLVGFNSTAGSCPNFAAVTMDDRTQMSTPFVLATATKNLNGADVEIDMTVSLTMPNNRIAKCKFGMFTWEESSEGKFGTARFDSSTFGP